MGKFYARHLKRPLDVAMASIGLVVISPVLGVTAVWLHFANQGAGVLFRQRRPGLHRKIFNILKFKTMTDQRDADGNLLPDEQRITRAGRFVRSTSLDELPQLFNVLRGDMSLIGPRPLLPEYVPYYTDREQTRHNVRPGITGWAQVNGRNHLNWDDRLECDAQYVENISLAMDVKIIAMTVRNILCRKDIEVVTTDEGCLNDLRHPNPNYKANTTTDKA